MIFDNKYDNSNLKLIAFIVFLLVIFISGWAIFANNLANFFIWDAGYYHKISIENYNAYSKDTPAFFPLLPLIIASLKQNQYLITLANTFFLCSGAIILQKIIKIDLKWWMFIILTSHFFYFFLPYTESIFFIGGAILLAGIHKKQTAITCLGIAICSLSRPVFVLLSFSFIVLFFIEWYVSKKRNYTLIFYSFLALFTTACHFSYLKLKTGNWMAFFDAQKLWGHKIEKGITFPFELNHVAVGFFLIIAFVYCLVAIYFVLNVINFKIKSDRATLFSAIFLSSFLGLMINIQTPDFSGLNRYILCSPFFVYFLIAIKKNFPNLFSNQKILLFSIIAAVNIAFWSNLPLKNIITFFFSTIYFYFFYFFIPQTKISKMCFYLYCLLLLGLQIYFLNRFIHFLWVSG